MESLTGKFALLNESLKESLLSLEQTVKSQEVQNALVQASEAIRKSYLNGGCLFVAGNGGSAADSQHLVAELVSKLCKDRDPIRAFALTVDTSILTAIGNDYGYEFAFSRQVEGLMKKNDIFLGLTTSGNSKNILKALEKCKELGIPSIVFTGLTGGRTKGLCDIMIQVPSENTRLIQESHLVLYHILCNMIESDLIDAGLCKYR